MYRISILNIFVFFFLSAFAQNADIERNKKILASKAHDTLKLFAYSDLNWLYSTSDVHKSLEYGLGELKLSKKIKNDKWIAQSFNDIAISYYKMGQMDSALNYNHKALELRRKLGDKLLIASSLSKIGVVYSEIGNYKKSLEAHYQSLGYFDTLHPAYYAMTLNNIALVYEKLQSHDKTIQYALKAVQVHLKNGDEYGAASCYGNLANAYKKKKDLEKSDYYLEKAIVIFRKFGDKVNEAGILNSFAVNMRERNQNQKALSFYKKAYDLAKESGDAMGRNLYGHNISCVLRDLGKYREAEQYSLAGLENTEKLNKAQLLLTYRQLATLYGYLNDGKQAEHYLNHYTSLKDSIFSEKSASQIAEMEVKYETEKTLKELAQQKERLAQKEKINSMNQLRLESRKKWMIGGFSAALLLAIASFWIYRSQRIKRQNEKREYQLSKQLETVVLEKGFADEKIRIARELHDNIGSHLTFMISSLDNLAYDKNRESKLAKIGDLSNFGRLTMKDLRDTIWAMNHDGGTVEQLITRISELRSVLPDNLEVEINNTVDPDKDMNGLQLLNCFRIVQEFIQNSIKYAEADLIRVSISKVENGFSLHISDNGSGFDISKINFGNGILNMQRRCEDLGGTFEINSSSKGTRIECLIPWKIKQVQSVG